MSPALIQIALWIPFALVVALSELICAARQGKLAASLSAAKDSDSMEYWLKKFFGIS